MESLLSFSLQGFNPLAYCRIHSQLFCSPFLFDFLSFVFLCLPVYINAERSPPPARPLGKLQTKENT